MLGTRSFNRGNRHPRPRRLVFEDLEVRRLLSLSSPSLTALKGTNGPTPTVETSVTDVGAGQPSFTLTGPTAGTFSAGVSVTIQWSAANVDVTGPSKISLGYDPEAAIDANEHWIEVDQVTAANGAGAFNWNTTGAASGTYYLGGYMYDFSTDQAIYSHLSTSIVITGGAPPAFTLLAPGSGTFSAGVSVSINWTATNVDVAGPSKISLGYDRDTTPFDANEHWIEIDGVTAANGAASYDWNTSGVASGVYYLSGYMYDFSTDQAIYSHLGTSIVIIGAPPTFTLTGPTAGTFSAGVSVTIQWSAANADVAGPSKISLGYDPDAAVDANEHWIEVDQVTAANGAGSYIWNTTSAASGTYYLGGYIFDFATHQAVYAHLGTSIVITGGAPPAFTLLGPTSGTFSAGVSVTIQWTAANVDVAGPAKITLGYDPDATPFDANEHWIEIDEVAAANGAGSYSWNTTDVAAGTYYLDGYMYDFSTSTAKFSSLNSPIVIGAPASQPPPTNLTTLALLNAPQGAELESGVIRDSNGDLFGTAVTGGTYGWGTVYDIQAGSRSITILASFNLVNGASPYGNLVEDASGNLFGTTSAGGAFGDGTVFEVKADNGTITGLVTTLASFNSTDGRVPLGGLIEDASGDLFGTTNLGGAFGPYGTVFEIRAGSGSITTLASFNSTDGSNPYGNLVEDASGDLFGTTGTGGAFNRGTVFEVKAGSGTITVLASFNGTNGSYPQAGLVEDAGGDLFGTTPNGGASSDGTVFEIPSTGGSITTVATFNDSNGANPYAPLFEDASGDLFGTTVHQGPDGYGTVFEIESGSHSVTTLAAFNQTGGLNPYGGLVEDASGDLFGTTMNVSGSGYGTVFEVASGSGSATTLATPSDPNGTNPMGPLIEDASGHLFGTTSAGGAFGDGTVFEVNAATGSVTTLASFNGTDGMNPASGLVEDASGNLFGTTPDGGAFSQGTVFEVLAGSGVISTLASFNGTNGATPMAGVVEDASGNLFGTTASGGQFGMGTVFEVKVDSGAATTLASFNGVNGASPEGGLVEDAGGNLFGTTSAGGASGLGTVFEIQAGSNSITTLASFNNTNGASPKATLIEDSHGNLFGTTATGGSFGSGTVFEIAAGSTSILTLASFNGANGSAPSGALAEDPSGNLFGTTTSGGSDGLGTVFDIPFGSGSVTTLANFNGTNGANPYGGVVEDSSGDLFGTTSWTTGGGTVFELSNSA
jgi:uncharacterized repeat protein (TIGR03803 family)